MMRISGLSRHALFSCVAVAMLAGCGGSQPPIGASGAMPQSRAIAQARAHRASSGALIYATGGCGGTCILSYPQGKLVGQIATGGAAVCSDGQGNVFISAVEGDLVYEYAHGGTTPIATLTLPGDQAFGCAVDPMTNNLAVVFGDSGVAVYSNESGSPTVYASKLEASYCGYDNAGNLFVSGYNVQAHAISELPQGKANFTVLSVNGKLGTPGQVQWDGTYMAYEARGSVPAISIARLSISGYVATVVSKTSFRGTMREAAQSWIYQGNILLPYGKKAVKVNKLGLWPYPKGGKPTRIIKLVNTKPWEFSGVTVSVAPTR
jgi:hypothetical protein